MPVSPRPSRVFSSPCPATALPLSVSPTRPAPLPTFPLKPSCALSLQEDNTIRPYAVVDLTAAKAGFRTVRIQGVQIFAGQVTLAQPEMIPETEEDRDVVNPPIVIPEHSLFTGDGSGPDPMENCVPRVLDRVIIPKTSRCIWQACGIRPQCDCLLPGLYRQCCIQRSLPYLVRPCGPTSTARSLWRSTAFIPSGIPARGTASTLPTPPATTSITFTDAPCSM